MHLCSTAVLVGNTFDQNVVEEEDTTLRGGGLHLDGDSCDNDKAARGGASATANQVGNRFTRNVVRGEVSAGYGGGEHAEDLTLLSTADRFVGNRVEGTDLAVGGGLSFRGNGSDPFTARNLVAAGNTLAPEGSQPTRSELPGGRGGGLALLGRSSSTFRLEDSTIQGNTASEGSGIAGQVPQTFPGPALSRGINFDTLASTTRSCTATPVRSTVRRQGQTGRSMGSPSAR